MGHTPLVNQSRHPSGTTMTKTFKYAMWRNPTYGTLYLVKYNTTDGSIHRAATVSDDWLESGNAFTHGTNHFIQSLTPAMAYPEAWLHEKYIHEALLTGQYDVQTT